MEANERFVHDIRGAFAFIIGNNYGSHLMVDTAAFWSVSLIKPDLSSSTYLKIGGFLVSLAVVDTISEQTAGVPS